MVNETVNINFQAGNLDAVEAKIKAIGGAINILGGSVELLVGSMGLIGIDDKVQKQFQEAATSAIAFADGAKRVFEGYKELREAAQLFSKAEQVATAVTTANTTATVANNAAQASSIGILGKAKAAWAAFTGVLARNPITAIAVALTAVIGSLIAYTAMTDDAEEATDGLTRAQKDLLLAMQSTGTVMSMTQTVRLSRLKASGKSERLILKQQIQDAKDVLAEAKKNAEEFAKSAGITVVTAANTAKKIAGTGLNQTSSILKGGTAAAQDEYRKLVDATNQAVVDVALAQDNLTIYDKAAAKESVQTNKEKQAEIDKIRLESIRNNQLLQLQGYDRELQELDNYFDDKFSQVVGNKKAEEALENEYLTKFAQLNKKYREQDKKQKQDLYTNALEGRQRELAESDNFFKEQFNIYKDNEIMLNNLTEYQRSVRLKINQKWDKLQEEANKDAAEKAQKDLKDNNEKILAELLSTDQRTYLLRLKLLEKFFETQMKAYSKDSEEYKRLQKEKTEATAAFVAKGSQLTEFFNDEVAKGIGGTLSALNSITSGMLSIAEQNSEDRLNAIEVEYNAKLQNITGTEEEIAAQTEQIEYEKNVKMEAERKRAFDDNKKLKIADTITSGLSAAFQAFGGAMSLGPILGPIIGTALATMIIAQMTNTVSSIRKQQYTGSAPTPPSRGGGISPTGGSGGGATGGTATALLGGGFNQPIPNPNDPGNQPFGSSGSPMNAPPQPMNTQPIRAYVVSSDISNGLEAEQQLQNRRRL